MKNGSGKMKEYNFFGRLIFYGEYSNGFRNGFGKEYNYNNIIIYEGEYLNGEIMEKEKNIQ